jgi:hypothetical protein
MKKLETFEDAKDFAETWQVHGTYKLTDFLRAIPPYDWDTEHDDNLIPVVMREYDKAGAPDGSTREGAIRYFTRIGL